MTSADDLFAEHESSKMPERGLSRLPSAAPAAMGWSDYLGAAWRNWWIVLIALVLGVIGAAAATASESRNHTSDTLLAVAPRPDLPLTATMAEIKQEKVATAAELVSGAQMMDRAADQAGVPRSAADAYTATGTASLRGATVDLTVTGPDAEVAAQLSSALVGIVGEEYARLYNGYTLNIVDGPTIATASSGPSRTLELAVGAIVGLGIGFLIAIARESSRRARR